MVNVRERRTTLRERVASEIPERDIKVLLTEQRNDKPWVYRPVFYGGFEICRGVFCKDGGKVDVYASALWLSIRDLDPPRIVKVWLGDDLPAERIPRILTALDALIHFPEVLFRKRDITANCVRVKL